MTIAEVTVTAEATTITEVMIIATATTTTGTTITVITRIVTIGKMTIIGAMIVTADNRGTTKGTTDRKMYAMSDGVLPTTIGGGPALQGLNHRIRRNNTTEIDTNNTNEHRQR